MRGMGNHPQMTQIGTDGENERRDSLTLAVIEATMEVHRHLKKGFLEVIDQVALALELAARGIPFEREGERPGRDQGRVLACTSRVDFVGSRIVIIAMKAPRKLTLREHSQIINYLCSNVCQTISYLDAFDR
jgi:GxxExxY protein